MHNITRNSTISLILGFIFFSISFTSCYIDTRDFGYADYVDNFYSVSGYLYPVGRPDFPSYYYRNVGLDIERTGYNRVAVSLYVYDGYFRPTYDDFFWPFIELDCWVKYDYYNNAYRIYNNTYGNAMTLLVYDNGYVWFDFNYPAIDYRGPCGYFFDGYASPYYYKAPAKDSISSRPVNIKPE